MAKFGLKDSHAQYLALLGSSPEILTVNQMCQLLGKEKLTVSRMATELEKAELLCRQYRDSSHYRSYLVLTDRGREVAQALRERAVQVVQQVGGDLTQAQEEAFYQVMELVGQRLRSLSQEGLGEKREIETFPETEL